MVAVSSLWLGLHLRLSTVPWRERREKVTVGVLWLQARMRLLEDDHPVEALAMDELASSSVEQVAACSSPASSPTFIIAFPIIPRPHLQCIFPKFKMRGMNLPSAGQ